MYDVTHLTLGDREIQVVLSQMERRVLSLVGPRLSEASLKVIQSVFLWAHANRPRSIPGEILAQAVREVLDAIEAEGEKLSYVYGFVVKEGPMASSGSGGISGIRMPGDSDAYYSLWAGIGELRLKRMLVSGDGTGQDVEVRDCRERKSLVTENMGVIQIKRRKVKLSLPDRFAELHSDLLHAGPVELQLAYEETRSRPEGQDRSVGQAERGGPV